MCLSPPTSSYILGFPDGEVAGKFFIFKEMKTGNYCVTGGEVGEEFGFCVCVLVVVFDICL